MFHPNTRLLFVALSTCMLLLLNLQPVMAINESQDVSTWSAMDRSVEPEEDVLSTKIKIDYVGYVIVPTVLIIGLFGNCMTLAVMGHKGFRKMPSSLVLRALSISDTTLIVLLPFNKQFVMQLLGMDIRAVSTPICKLFFWTWKTAKMTSSWLVFLLTLERSVAVLIPMRAHQLITRRNVGIGIVLVYIGNGGFNAAWESLVTRVEGGRCLVNIAPPGYEALAKGLVIAGALIYCYIPGALIMIFNVSIVLRLLIESKKRKKLAKVEVNNDATVRTTVMLLTVSFAFVILVIPIGTAHIMSVLSSLNIYETNHLPMVIFREIFQVMELVNYSINFFLYVMCCEKFRMYAWCILRSPTSQCACFHSFARRNADEKKSAYQGAETFSPTATKTIESEVHN